MTTPRFLLIFLLLAASALPQTALSAQPNFIFFITDDISPEDTGPYGSKVVKTPHLDRMAAEGLVFDNAYLTASSCSPSRCSIITGRYPHNTGAPELHLPLPKDQHTFVQDLRSAGYHTVISGKNHIGKPEDIGFDVEGKGGKPSGSEDWVTLLKERPKDKPFFAWFGSFDAHRDWQINDEAPKYDPADVVVPPFLFDGPQTRQDLADYYHEVSRSDFYLGQLFKELERQGIAQDTYVVYCADNGRPFPRCKTRLYDSGIKTPLLFWRPGTIQPARTASLVSSIDLSATFLDLAGLPAAPSIQGVSFAKILSDPKTSVRDYVFAEHNWHVFNAHERLVRHGDWLYIRNNRPNQQNMCTESDDSFPAGAELWAAHAEKKTSHAQQDIFLNPRPAEELFHVGKDAHQLYNLATDTTYQETLLELRQVLGQWTKETGDTNPEKPTPDRTVKRGPQPRGELPGQSMNAASINHPGPVRK
ncbi:sulfatase [Prosthecobacter sp. SYSU 5D2]|uniref:sulfatase family protein n=1 Tax=Prosthecobacter sp. SYSU 5D2 TaxID=3134134 RepID=UPI0031FEE66F